MLTSSLTSSLTSFQDLFANLECICKEKGWPIAKWVGSREKHADGTHHVHIGIHFVKRPNIKDPRVFDFLGCEVEGCCPDEGLRPHLSGFHNWKRLDDYVNSILFDSVGL